MPRASAYGDEGQAEAERVDDQEERAGEGVRAERGEGQGGGEVRPDARGPAEAEDDADEEGSEDAAPAEAFGELEARVRSRRPTLTTPMIARPKRITATPPTISTIRPLTGAVGDSGDATGGQSEEHEDDGEAGDVEQRTGEQAQAEAVPVRVGQLGGADPGDACEVGGQQRDRARCEEGSEPRDEGREHRGNREHQPKVKV